MIKLKNFEIGNGKPFVLIAGPCVVENEKITFNTASEIKRISAELGIPFVFKSSYKKANRTSVTSFSGPGDAEGLRILSKIKEELDLPLLTDIHTSEEASAAGDTADILQIPAFLCRQTELLLAAAKTGRIINIKKGQFLAPEEMKHAADKIKSAGNEKILLTERGTTFGYNNLVVDMRSLVIMRELGYPVVMDATHSVQMPGAGGVTGGSPRFIPYLAKAAAAVGIAALFLEVHPDPPNALSDAASQLPLDDLKELLIEIQQIDRLIKKYE